jgi:hypothetical protein
VGGSNFYSYTRNPIGSVDVFELSSKSSPTPCKKCAVVIGESQWRVNLYAKLQKPIASKMGYDLKTIGNRDWPKEVFFKDANGKGRAPATETEWKGALDYNRQWIRDRMKEGCKFIDIGRDPAKANDPVSRYYEMELETLKGYPRMDVRSDFVEKLIGPHRR